MACLRDLILFSLRESKQTTAREQAATWGEDRVRCREWLDKFVDGGVAKVLKGDPDNIYVLIPGATVAEISKICP